MGFRGKNWSLHRRVESLYSIYATTPVLVPQYDSLYSKSGFLHLMKRKKRRESCCSSLLLHPELVLVQCAGKESSPPQHEHTYSFSSSS
jgi:hypothetical protein